MNTISMGRRSFVRGLPLAAGAAVFPAAAVASSLDATEAKLSGLMVAWRRQYDIASTSPEVRDGEPDPESDRLFAIEDEVAGILPTTVAGFALKLLILTNFGRFDLDGPAEVILADAETIAAVPAPSTMKREEA